MLTLKVNFVIIYKIGERYYARIRIYNNDGHNDKFRVSVVGGDEYELIVFDRWGKEVFRTEDPQEGWDGNYKNGNPAEQAVYTYKVIVHNGDTGQQIQRVKVTLAK